MAPKIRPIEKEPMAITLTMEKSRGGIGEKELRICSRMNIPENDNKYKIEVTMTRTVNFFITFYPFYEKNAGPVKNTDWHLILLSFA